VLAERLHAAASDTLKLGLITNRGVKVYPEGVPETFRTDHWRCRFKSNVRELPYASVLELMQRISASGRISAW
jgi:isocitrate dehydrogenase